MRFTGKDGDIDLASEHPEFRAWKWVPIEVLPDLIVSFKRPGLPRSVGRVWRANAPFSATRRSDHPDDDGGRQRQRKASCTTYCVGFRRVGVGAAWRERGGDESSEI
jgi:hypothetical protein